MDVTRATRQILCVWLLVLLAAPAAAQDRAGGRAVLEIGEIMSLQVQPGGGLAVLDADGVHREIEDAVRLKIFANRPWQLFVVAEPERGEGPAGAEEDVVWWRADVGQADGAYRRAQPWPILVTGGQRGRAVVDVAYRWVDAPGRELEPGTVLHFTLSAR